MEKQKETIIITHFINPHLFWYHKVDPCNKDYISILEIEKELAQFYTDHQSWTQALRHPPKRALVAVKFLAWNKMIRARVDHIAGFGKSAMGGEFIMWAIDYGFPFQTKADHIYKLPEKLATPINYIHCGGLANILPAEHFFMKNTMVKRVSAKWHQRSCDVVEKATNDCESITFIKSLHFNGQDWGELIVQTNMGIKYRVKDHLISLHLAVDAESNFSKECQKLQTNKILPWLCNSGSTKLHTNRAYIYPAVIGITYNAEKLSLECDVEAKQKVEEWYERNQLKSVNDGGLLDTTSEYTMTEGSIIDTLSNRKYDLQGTNLPRIDEFEESQHMHLAGVLSKSRMEKYSSGKLSAPPLPSTIAFQMKTADDSIKANQTIETSDSEISAIEYIPLEDSTIVNVAVTPTAAPACVNVLHEEIKVDNDCIIKTTEKAKSKETGSIPKSNEIGLFAEYLVTLRNEYIESKTNEEQTSNIPNALVYEEPKMETKFNFPQIENIKQNRDESQDLLNTTFYGQRMIPAGYDIMNFHEYNDEHHWHCKKSTLNDRIPHNDMDLLDFIK